jgi:ribosomal protein L37AE/L43A
VTALTVCSCGEYGSAGCRHTNPQLAPKTEPHRCPTPGDYPYRHSYQTWECGGCGKIWQPGQFGWTEIRGATT